ncbi:MAG: glucose-1-phosphate adenylyltransferase [Planctomycetes bacterium]|nr:glucose-1-phosphate adenylyltransferase [Planctomycetota bacterium]
MNRVMCMVLGGGRGTRLFPLTKYRSKPAVPLAGKYRLIDIPISNCINSGMKQIYVLTQFLSVSLHRHIRRSYTFDRFGDGFVEILAAQQTEEPGTDWYQGTADAVRKNLRYIEHSDADYVLILSGDQLYQMDYRDMLRVHRETGAQVTIGAFPVSRNEVSALGVMRVDESGRVVGFLEKPQQQEEVETVTMDPKWIDARGVESKGRECLANMGIYLFDRQTLIDLLTHTEHYQDFGKEVFPAAIRSKKVQVHLFDGYWEDIGTVAAFFEANVSLASPNPPFNLAAPESPIYTRARMLQPTRLDGAQVSGALLADGCRIGKGAVIENSVIGIRCIIGDGVTIRNSVLFGADYYETDLQLTKDQSAGLPPLGIGDGSVIEGVIIDKNCRIGRNVQIIRQENAPDADHDPLYIRDGVPVVVKEGVLNDGWRL